jgi:hypothetical protein
MPVTGTPAPITPLPTGGAVPSTALTGVIATPASSGVCSDTPCSTTACGTAPNIGSPTPAPVPCDDIEVLSVEPATLHGTSLRTKLRSVSLQQGQCVTIEWTLHDRNGKPVDLSGCVSVSESSSSAAEGEDLPSSSSAAAAPPEVRFRIREFISTNAGRHAYQEVTAEVVDPAYGRVRAELTKAQTKLAGVFFGEMALMQTNDDGTQCVILSNVFYLIINKGLYGSDKFRGAPTIGEIRLHLRDSHPEESYLLDGLAFDNAEIAQAIARPIEYWNEVPPPIRTYTTITFPFRFHWLEAIIGELFRMAEETQRRNQLSYSAGGINIDDMNKERNYGNAALIRLQAWKDFVRMKKASLNLQDAIGEVGSPYG